MGETAFMEKILIYFGFFFSEFSSSELKFNQREISASLKNNMDIYFILINLNAFELLSLF